MAIEELRKKRMDLHNRTTKTLDNMNAIALESKRVADVAHNSEKILNNLEREFESQTGLNGTDIKFLFFAIAVQCARQYLFTSFEERRTDKEAAKEVKDTKETSDRSHKWYKPTLAEITSNPVPYDAMFGSPDFDLGLGGSSHRFKTLGP